ncbi:MAG: HIT family protein [Bacteroidetes bacterium]|nr:HIT family protein [Bacteroidota bacterium]
MASIFTQIINGEIPCYKIAENENYIAFLDVNPLANGHTLVVPKQETDYIFNLDNETYNGLWLFAKEVAAKVQKAIPCKRIGIAVIGLEVPHAHIHLVPLQTIGDINFERVKLHPSPDELAEAQFLILGSF